MSSSSSTALSATTITEKLDPQEFQGFALVDEFAPLIFVNAADYIAAQIFTLAHEAVHLLIGETGLSSFDRLLPAHNATERFCNRVSAEFLVPAEELRGLLACSPTRKGTHTKGLPRKFKVSAIVAARRALDLRLIDRDAFFVFYEMHKDQGRRRPTDRSGGSFWNTQRWRIGPRFGDAVVRATREGRLLYREAYSLTGLKRNTFEKLPEGMGIQL